MPAWPDTLPCQPVQGSLRIRQEPNVAEFKPDVGRAQRSKRYTLTRKMYSGTIKCTTAQTQILMDFFDDDCASGVNSFTMRDWGPNSNSPPESTFTFTSAPEFEKSSGNFWLVSLELAREN